MPNAETIERPYPWKNWFVILPAYASSIFLYLLCFKFTRSVLWGDYTATGPVTNIVLFYLLTIPAGVLLLLAIKRSPLAGFFFSIAAPFLFPTLFVQALIGVYEITGRSHPMMDKPGDALRWLISAPTIVMQLWYIFLIPSILWWMLLAKSVMSKRPLQKPAG